MKAIIEENYENFKAIDAEIYSKNNIWKIYRYVNQYKKDGKGKYIYNNGHKYAGE